MVWEIQTPWPDDPSSWCALCYLDTTGSSWNSIDWQNLLDSEQEDQSWQVVWVRENPDTRRRDPETLLHDLQSKHNWIVMKIYVSCKILLFFNFLDQSWQLVWERENQTPWPEDPSSRCAIKALLNHWGIQFISKTSWTLKKVDQSWKVVWIFVKFKEVWFCLKKLRPF